MRSRLVAAGIHLVASGVAVLAVALLIFGVWFPGEYSRLLNGYRLFGLVSVCDLVLGPAITLVIWSPSKSRSKLLFDYVIIGAIQLSALVYGASVVAATRPVFTVFAVDRFEIVTAAEVATAPSTVAAPQPALAPGWLGPQLATLVLPQDRVQHNAATTYELSGNQLSATLNYLTPYDNLKALHAAKPIEELLGKHHELQPEVARLANRAHVRTDQLSWVPVSSRFGFFTALLSAESNGIIGFLQLDPY